MANKQLFASHRGRLVLRCFYALLALAFVMFLIPSGGGGGSSSNSDENIAISDDGDNSVPVAGNNVYASPSASASDNNSTGTTEATPDDKTVIINGAKTVATNFVTAWISYDYHKPLSNSIAGMPKDKNYSSTVMSQLKSYNDEMVKNKSLSTGNITSVAIKKLVYNGDSDDGAGTGTVQVNATTTISNSSTGAAGAQAQMVYQVDVRRVSTQDSSPDTGKWIVTSIQGQKQ